MEIRVNKRHNLSLKFKNNKNIYIRYKNGTKNNKKIQNIINLNFV